MARTVDEMVGRIDERTEWMVDEMKTMRRWQVDQDKRLGKLEAFRGWLVGVGAAIVAITGVLVKLF
jgi:hypothetical protein